MFQSEKARVLCADLVFNLKIQQKKYVAEDNSEGMQAGACTAWEFANTASIIL